MTFVAHKKGVLMVLVAALMFGSYGVYVHDAGTYFLRV